MTDKAANVLIVDDEAPVRRLLRRCFESEQYSVHEASNSKEMFAVLGCEAIDLITLDLNLGDENGLDLARQIRATSEVGIIVVSGKGDLIDTVVGLEMGADDYISKPFQVREVLARARSVLRRTRQTITSENTPSLTGGASSYCFAQWTLTPSKRRLADQDGKQTELTSAEFDLLEVLVQNAGNVLSRNQIMDKLKGHDWNPNDRTIDNQIVRLRKKLDPDGELKVITSVRGVGYIFTLDVS